MRMTILLVGLLIITGTVQGEELLKKNGGNYLGKKKSSDTFVTCEGGEIKIAPGTVEPTPRICSRAVDMGVVEITKIEPNDRAVTVKDSNNTEIRFTLKPSESSALTAAVGTKIRLSGTSEQNRRLSQVD